MTDACTEASRVDRHFDGALAPEGELAMREHLGTCSTCRTRYERMLVLEALDPARLRAEERIARGLGISEPRSNVIAWRGAVTALAMAAALLLFFGSRTLRPNDGEFTARGGGAGMSDVAGSSVLVYKSASLAKPTRAGDAIGARDELAFAYENASAKRYLMIFGIDEHRHVFWYHPGWASPAEDPQSIAIETTPGMHRLNEAIAHQLDGSELEIHALFTDSPLTVKAVEKLIASETPKQASVYATGATESTLRFKVER